MNDKFFVALFAASLTCNFFLFWLVTAMHKALRSYGDEKKKQDALVDEEVKKLLKERMTK